MKKAESASFGFPPEFQDLKESLDERIVSPLVSAGSLGTAPRYPPKLLCIINFSKGEEYSCISCVGHSNLRVQNLFQEQFPL